MSERVPSVGRVIDLNYPASSPDRNAWRRVPFITQHIFREESCADGTLEAEHEAAWAVLVAAAINYAQVSSISLEHVGPDLAEALEAIVENS